MKRIKVSLRLHDKELVGVEMIVDPNLLCDLLNFGKFPSHCDLEVTDMPDEVRPDVVAR